MISVEAAKQMIIDATEPVTRICSLHDACGLVLAAPVQSPVDLPLFDNAAMDGYALRYADYIVGQEFDIVGEVAAGDVAVVLPAGPCVLSIFTGAVLPSGADTVIQQELVSIVNGKVRMHSADLRVGKNVRRKGSELRQQETLLSEGLLLTPAAIGLLASAGISQVPVYRRPKVAVLVTGKELKGTEVPLESGQIYESNSYMLSAALQQVGIDVATTLTVQDTLQDTVAQLGKALEDADLVLLSGGISVGDYDFVLEATRACGVMEQFYKVRQKPGKPLFFGTKAGKYVFALPGNPGSALTCFYEYVLLCLSTALKRPELYNRRQARFDGAYEKGVGLAHFLKGRFDGTKVVNLGAQESYKLISFAVANCLIFVPEDAAGIHDGDQVDILTIS